MAIKIIVTCLMGPGTLEAKLIPLSNSKLVSKIIVLRKEIGPPINKVEYIKLPYFCKISFFNVLITPFMLAYYATINKVDLILSYHFIPHAFFAYIASVITKIPFNVSQTGLYIQNYAAMKRYSKLIIHILRKSCFINVPGYSSKAFWIYNGIPENKLYVLHSRIDSDKFKNLNVEKVFDYIYLGRLSEEKQVDIIIKGIYEMCNKGLNVKLIIVGDGSEMNELKKLTNTLKLTNNITFIGFVDDPEIWLNKAKIFLMCSKSEGLPTALMQAMSCKLLSIAPNVGNISDLIENNDNGFLYEANDLKSFYKIMEQTYLNYDILNNIREKAREKILKFYTYENATDSWDTIISSKFPIAPSF